VRVVGDEVDDEVEPGGGAVGERGVILEGGAEKLSAEILCR
jgi:hypothetical protein